MADAHRFDCSSILDPALINVFDSLDFVDRISCETVCRHWNQLARKSWGKVARLRVGSDMSAKKLECLLQRCGYSLLELYLERESTELERTLISVSGSRNGILGMLPNLKNLTVITDLCEADLAYLSEQLPHLEYLRFKEFVRRDNFVKTADIKVPTGLRCVELDGSHNMDEILQAVDHQCKYLTSLPLHGDKVSGAFLSHNFEYFTRLTFLGAEIGLHKRRFINVLDSLHNLKALKLFSIGAEVATAIAQKCQKLEYFSAWWFDGTGHDDISALAALPNLKYLRIRKSNCSLDKSIEAVAQNGMLQYLALGSMKIGMNCLAQTVLNCKDLRYLGFWEGYGSNELGEAEKAHAIQQFSQLFSALDKHHLGESPPKTECEKIHICKDTFPAFLKPHSWIHYGPVYDTHDEEEPMNAVQRRFMYESLSCKQVPRI